jgi:hypothetical protein
VREKRGSGGRIGLALVTLASLLPIAMTTGCLQGSELPAKSSLSLSETLVMRDPIDELLNYTYTQPLDIDLLWMLKKINEYYPRQETVATLEEKRNHFHENPDASKFNPNYLRLIDENYTPAGEICGPKDLDFDCLILQSIYCDVVPLQQDYIGSLEGINVGGMGTTHYLLALLELNRKKCYNSSALGSVISDAIETLTEELSLATSEGIGDYDVYAESAAMIMLAGRYDQIDEKWILEIKKDLVKKAGNISKEEISLHETLLEILAVVQWESFNLSGGAA